ncbi:MAG: 30S ribosomal protein S6 [Clostridiales bacterium]|nr:30S ribosomal protein S6 [Candidatus Equinaster intestinalis]
MVTNKYEAVLVFSVKAGDEAVAALNEKFQKLIADNGTVENVDDWGKRKLAYPINYETEGYYVFTTFTAEPGVPAEIERIAGITDGVLRVMIIKK